MDVKELQLHGQSIWLDYFRRDLITSGELARMVREDGLRGITTNPNIFEQAISGTSLYDAALERDVRRRDESPREIYEQLAIDDIQRAADVLRPVYDATDGADGFVSMEVSPYLAHDTRGTIAEARRLWRAIGRDNVMIKVPGTPEGVPAIERLVGEGININVTLLFSREACRQVREAHIRGLESLVAHGAPIDRVAGVASMFVSRVDVLADSALREHIANASDEDRPALLGLLGKVGIANAKLAYQDWKASCETPRWRALAARGARPQRMLWASTGTKSPAQRDVIYVESLIGPETIDTVPPKTLDALRDHGSVADRLEQGVDEAQKVMDTLERFGISIDALADRLVGEGVDKFAAAFDSLFSSIAKKRTAVLHGALDRISYTLPQALNAQVAATLADWRMGGKVRRLWARDATLWTDRGEEHWMGWLDLVGRELRTVHELVELGTTIRYRGFADAVVLGMGGSSLCAEVLADTFGRVVGSPRLHVLDSVDPAQILALQARIEVRDTLFIVASKSGTTLEPNLLASYFYALVRNEVGDADTGAHFIALTDEGSPLQRRAEMNHYARTFIGPADVGGRYSALSSFGMVPAAVMGLPVPELLERADTMVRACAAYVPPEENPGALLGVILGTLAKAGRDKVTFVLSPDIAQLGAWLEQLLAESTGKAGKGLVPVVQESLGAPEVYGDDRVFIYLRFDRAADAFQDAAVAELRGAGQPVVQIAVAEPLDIGQEFFRWQMAVAVAASILGVDPFDQPDVEAAKIQARELVEQFESEGTLPPEAPIHREAGLALFADERTHRALVREVGPAPDLVALLRAHLQQSRPGDYVALLAFLERTPAHEERLQHMGASVRDARKVATSVGFGPRYLHSTGQLHKGGPNTGVFLQITSDDVRDLQVPGRAYTFGLVKAAQARGDLAVLVERGRRVLRVHLGRDVDGGLATLQSAIERAMS